MLADQTKTCPGQKGASWQKKNRFLERRVFYHRRPPNDKRADEVVHDVIALNDDPIVAQQLRAAQENQRPPNAEALIALANGPNGTTSDISDTQ